MTEVIWLSYSHPVKTGKPPPAPDPKRRGPTPLHDPPLIAMHLVRVVDGITDEHPRCTDRSGRQIGTPTISRGFRLACVACLTLSQRNP